MAIEPWPDDTPEHKKLKAHYAHLAKKGTYGLKELAAAAGLVALADAGGGDAGPGAGAPGVGLPGETISEAAAGAAAGKPGEAKTALGGHAPKKIASALGEAKFHGNIGDLIIPHGKTHWVEGKPGHFVHSISAELWKANQWGKDSAKHAVEQGTHHYVQSGQHSYAVHNGLDVHVPKDVDTSDEAQVKAAPKIVVKKGPNPEHVVLHPDTGPGKPVPTSDQAIGNLAAHYKKLPLPEPKKAVTIGGKHAAWVPHHWQVHKSATTPEDKLTGKFAKDPGTGDWHYIGKTGKVEQLQPGTAANVEKWTGEGKLTKEDHETHEPAESHVAPTTEHPAPPPPPAEPPPPPKTPMLKVAPKPGEKPKGGMPAAPPEPPPAKTSGAESVKVDVGGIPVTKEEIHHAISALNKSQATNVKGPLKVAGSPLWEMDYMGVSKAELAKYPELLVPKGTKAKHVGQVKIAILHHLAGKLAELSATDAEQHVHEETIAKAEAAAEAAQDLTPHTYSWGGKTATKEQLQEAADWLQETMGGKQSFSQAMKKTGNPLATADYMGEAKKYKLAHPDTAKSWSTKKLMLESLKEHAGELAKADAETGHTDAATLHAYASQKVGALKAGWQTSPHGAVAAALLYAWHNKTNTYAFASHAMPGTWEVDFSPHESYSYFKVTPEHKVTMVYGLGGPGDEHDYAADMTLADAKSWISPPGAPPPEKPPVAPPKEYPKTYHYPKVKPAEPPPVVKLPEPEAQKPEPPPEPVAKVPAEPPPPAQLPSHEWKAVPEYFHIHKLLVEAKSTDVPGVAGDVDGALASGLWGAAKLEATRYILPKEDGGWKFSKTPGMTGTFGAPGDMYYRITPDHQVIFVAKDGTESAFTGSMVLKLAMLLAKKEEPKPEPPPAPPEPPPAPPEAAKPAPEPLTKEVKVYGKLAALVPESALIYHGLGAHPDSANFKYVKLKDGTWQKYGPSGTPYTEPVSGKYDKWVTNGQLVPEQVGKAEPKPPEPKPIKMGLPGIGNDYVDGLSGDSTWQDTQEPEYGTYIKHEDGTWSIQYKGGGSTTDLGENKALDNWIGNGLLKPLSTSAKKLAETSGAPEHKPEPDPEKPPLPPKAEPVTKSVIIKGKEVGKVPADAVLYWHHPTAIAESDAASYYVKYDDGSWGVFTQGIAGDQGTSEPGKLNEFVKAGVLIPSGQPKPPEAPPGDIPAILEGKVLGMVPAGSKFYTGKKPQYGYTPFYVLKPDGSWMESPYGNNLSKSWNGPGSKLEDGTLWEIPPPTPEQIAEAQAIAEVKAWSKTAAISEVDAQSKGWKGFLAEKMSGKSHYSAYEGYIFQYSGTGNWTSNNYTPHHASEYWHFNPDTLKVVHHWKPSPEYPEGKTEDVPVSEVIDAIKTLLTPNAVTVGGKVYKFGFYYSPKGKAYLEVKEAKTAGKYHKSKYGKAGGTAAFIWHDTAGNTSAKTPAWAENQLAKNTEYHETEKPLVPKAFFTSKYATTAEPGTYKLWSDAHGMNGTEHIVVKEDGSALWTDPSTGEHGTLFGTTQSMEGGMVLDKYGTTVVEPGTMPAQYHLFGSQGLTYMELEALRNNLQKTGGAQWAKVLWAALGNKDEAMSRVTAFFNDKGVSGGLEQYHSVMSLANELLTIPQQLAGAKPEAPPEVKYLKGLPPGIYGPKDIFKFASQGYAKPFAGSLNSNHLATLGSPELADTIKAISAQFGGGKVVGTHSASLTKPERLAWIHAWKKGDMQTVFNLDAKGGKVSPVHPGAPENTATHHMTWAPWDPGQIPASQTIAGSWSEPTVTPLKDEVDNYLIKMNFQHAAFLSVKERRLVVKLHRNGDQEAVDELSRTAAERYKADDKPLTAPPEWHDQLTPAKSYSVYLEDAKPASDWATAAIEDFIAGHKQQLIPFAQQSITEEGSSLTPEQWLEQSTYYTKKALQKYLDYEIKKAKDEALRSKWELIPGKPGYVKDQFGKTKLWFTGTKTEMGARIAVNALARAFGYRTPKAEYAKIESDGTPGVITDEVKQASTLDLLPGGLTSLEDRQLAGIAKEHVLDYLLANPTSSAASYLIMGDKAIVSAGKPGAFSDLGWKGADLAHLNDKMKQPVSLLFDAMKNGGVSKASADEAYIAAVRASQRMAKLGDSRFAGALSGTGLSGADITALTARKNALVEDITGLWDSVYGQLGWTPPEVPKAALEGGAHAGFDEVDLYEHLAKAQGHGVVTFFDEPGLASSAVHLWQEYNPQGHLDTRGEAVVRGGPLKNLISWVKQHSGGEAVVKLAPKDETDFHLAILKAAGNVKDHWSNPDSPQYGYFGGPISTETFNELDKTRKELEHRLQLGEEVLDKGASDPEYALFIDKYGDPHAVIDMAKQYLDQIHQISEDKLSGQIGKPTWHESSMYPAWELKGKVFEAAGGIKVSYQSATRFLGTKTETVTEHTWQLDKETGALHLKSNLSMDYKGKVWHVTLPTGETLDISDEEQSGTPRAQHGRLRFTAVTEEGSSSLENIRNFLQMAGLPMKEATQAGMENLYWRLAAAEMAGKRDRKNPKQSKMFGTLIKALGLSKTQVMSTPRFKLINDLVALGLPPEEEAAVWHEAMAHMASKEVIDKWVEAKAFMPHFGHYSLHAKDVPGGKPIFYRFDVTPQEVAKQDFLVQTFTSSPGKDAVLVARSGGVYSSEGRLRALGTHKEGMSWSSDEKHGSSGMVFLRQHQGTTGSGDYHVWISPRVTAQLQGYSYYSDKFGEVDDKKTLAAWDYHDHIHPTGAYGEGIQSNNEIMIPDAVSLLDDIEVLKAYSETQRQSIIKDLKALGITEIRGLPVEERIVTNAGVPAALKKARAALAAQSPGWFTGPVEWSVADLPADATPAEKAQLKAQQAMDIESQASQIASEAGGTPFSNGNSFQEPPLTAEKHLDTFGNEYVTLNIPVTTSGTTTYSTSANIPTGSITAENLSSGVIQWSAPKWLNDIEDHVDHYTISDGSGYTSYHKHGPYDMQFKSYAPHDKDHCPFCAQQGQVHEPFPLKKWSSAELEDMLKAAKQEFSPSAGLLPQGELEDVIAKLAKKDIKASHAAPGDGDGDGLDGPSCDIPGCKCPFHDDDGKS